ncbi:unnamed protein product [Cunninghamella blakesleeana]
MYTLKATYISNQDTHTLESEGKGPSLGQLVKAITTLKADLNKHLTEVIHNSNETNEIPIDEDHVEDPEEDEDEENDDLMKDIITDNNDITPTLKKQKVSP